MAGGRCPSDTVHHRRTLWSRPIPVFYYGFSRGTLASGRLGERWLLGPEHGGIDDQLEALEAPAFRSLDDDRVAGGGCDRYRTGRDVHLEDVKAVSRADGVRVDDLIGDEMAH